MAAFVELWLAVNLLSAVLAVSATLFYVFVYTLWLKRRSSQNIVIGGAAGAVPVLVGWAAVTDSLSWAPLVLFAIIFIWTPPHFWSLAVRYKEDYAAADVPMLPVVASMKRTTREILLYTVALVALTVSCSARWPTSAAIYLVTAAVLGAVFLFITTRMWGLAQHDRATGQRGHAGLQLLDHLPHGALRRHGGRRADLQPPPLASRGEHRPLREAASNTPGAAQATQGLSSHRRSWRRRPGRRALHQHRERARLRPARRTKGGPVPSFTATNLTAAATSSVPSDGGGSGTPAVLLFFGNWCPSCHQELPPLAAAVQRQNAAGGALSHIRVIGIDSEDSVASARAFIKSSGVTFPVAYDPNIEVTEGTFYFSGDPYAIFVRADGTIDRIVRGAGLSRRRLWRTSGPSFPAEGDRSGQWGRHGPGGQDHPRQGRQSLSHRARRAARPRGHRPGGPWPRRPGPMATLPSGTTMPPSSSRTRYSPLAAARLTSAFKRPAMSSPIPPKATVPSTRDAHRTQHGGVRSVGGPGASPTRIPTATRTAACSSSTTRTVAILAANSVGRPSGVDPRRFSTP